MRSCAILGTLLALLLLAGGQNPAGSTGAPAGASGRAAGAAERSSDREGNLPKPVSLEQAGLQTYWRAKIKLRFRERITRLDLLGDILYCLTNSGQLVAIDAKRGLIKWTYMVDATKKETIYRPSHPPLKVVLRVGVGEERKAKTFNAVVFNTVTRLIVLDRDTGQEMRNVELQLPANSSGASDGINEYLGSVKGLFHSFDLDKGVHGWTRKTDDMITAPVVYHNEHVYVGGEDHFFHVVTAGPWGRTVWKQELGGAIVAEFAVGPEGCFVPCEDGKLYAFHALTGEKLWEPFVCRAPLLDPAQVGRKAVFTYARGDKFYAVNITNGAELWSDPDDRLVLAVIGEDAYILDKDRNLRVIDEATGKIKFVVSLSKLGLFALNTRVPAVFASSDSGWVICINRTTEGHITPKMIKEAMEP